ncbi:type IV pilus-associated protein [Pseudomonas sp. M47T1]|nr:type IV pilus-associated protein [Pseudomonas sp. M47T1]
MRGLLKALLGMLLGIFISVPAFGFTPITAPLLSAAAVTPNVMLLVDNSGSMDSIIEDSGFDSTLTWPAVYSASYSCFLFFCGYSSGSQIGGGADYVFVGNLSQGTCSSGQYAFYRSSTAVTCLTLPDPRGSGQTRYPVDYLSYLVSKSNAGSAITVTSSTRMLTAISVAKTLVTANRNLRIGLSTFNPPTNADRGPGGNITQAISDLQPVTAYGTTGLVPTVTQTQANTNYQALINAIGGLSASSNTPLAETYYEITRYMRGMSPYYNSSPSTYTSPIQYRCQKNFGVVITDGLPTYDRTFPKNDPLGGTNLPNWDGINNDGNNLNGDDEGDTLYLDDIAKFAYDIDMKAVATNSTDATGKSWGAADFPKQNMFTYAIGFTASNQMLIDTASYGHGKYYLATDNASLTSALSSALSDITSKAGSGGSGTVSATTLTSSSFYYQTLYDPVDWRGIVEAFPLSSTGTASTTASWNTNTTMAVGTTAPTFESYNTVTAAPITMAYANYGAAQQTVLNANLPTGITGTNLVNWSKGTNITGLRTRTVLLGDIINSPLVQAAKTDQTASSLVGDSSYTTYLATKSVGMTNSLVVNANDGFTNVINASTGVRSYAYMPSTALASLYKVSDTGYINGNSHAFLNDGPIAVYDAQISSGWKTLALSGTGAGGKAYSAIQLYDATLGNVVKALWELRPDSFSASSSTPFADLGYAYSTPQVAKLSDGTWAAFIANGYGSTKGVASLFVVNLATGALIKEIVAESSNGSNGLSTVALKVNASNVVQAAYGGDLLGHMWKFDLSSTSTASWGMAFSGSPLFTAPGGSSQPITAAPLLITNATSGKMVYFGTGKLNETADKTTTAAQGFYAVWDADTNTTGNYTTANLQSQAVTGINSAGYVISTSNTTDYTSLKGWYLPLVFGTSLTGHRVIYQAAYKTSRIIFTSAFVDTTDACASQGAGYTFELNALNGSILSYPVLDTNGDGVVNSSDTIVSGIYISTGIPNLNGIIDVASTNSQVKIINDSSGTITKLVEAGTGTATLGRILWRQIQ